MLHHLSYASHCNLNKLPVNFVFTGLSVAANPNKKGESIGAAEQPGKEEDIR
jgi:hypothetical protein